VCTTKLVLSLYLDIWAPSSATNRSALPVKVWIYGGGEDAGGISYPLYDGCNLAQDDAILVTINYRLGPLGFLSLRSAGIQGNQGIQDLLMGLEWIQSNIAAFGGDSVALQLPDPTS
jgi:para-nitrobenzyl esterase